MAFDTILDMETIEMLREMDDEEDEFSFFGELVEEFLERAEELVQEIDTHVRQQDAAQLKASAHSLKGASLNLGAALQAQICEELETKGKNDDFTDINPLVEQLQDAYGQTVSALKSLIWSHVSFIV